MVFNHTNVRQELERWKNLAGPDDYSGPKTIGIHEVLDAHFLLQDHFSTYKRVSAVLDRAT